jgi:hypothetical protein
MEEVLHKLCVKVSNALGWDGEPTAAVGPPRQVQHHLAQGLIQWGGELAKAVDALAIPQGLHVAGVLTGCECALM